eukprot:207466_1
MSLCDHIINEGYLYKKGVFNTAWQRRYFVLYADRTVDYYKDIIYSSDRKKARGTIQLTQIQRVELVRHTNQLSSQRITHQVNNNKKYKQTNTIEHASFSGVLSSVQTPPDYQYEDPLALKDSASEPELQSAYRKSSYRKSSSSSQSGPLPQLYRSKSETLITCRYRKYSSNS